ncbi:hypothetical protein [Saccharopolyspora karakumensis]|uniref:hypothetical protein n=1 Tax=Saccharopolyspora karakumensis TaxID=2530386 RepID=UPI001F2C9820|nr:hypothetical protein [Saccharopolyspora karakumensis]
MATKNNRDRSMNRRLTPSIPETTFSAISGCGGATTSRSCAAEVTCSASLGSHEGTESFS